MKKITALIISLLAIVNIMTNLSFAAESNLIENIQMIVKSAETPSRLEISFDLTEPIDLSQGSSDIIFEYFIEGNAEAVYRKDKTWSGYVNSYDNYPLGEHKYSSGAEGQKFSDEVPAATIYTSTRSNSGVEMALIAAVRVTVLRADGSGAFVTIFDDQTTSATERISIPLLNVEENTGIRLDSTTEVLPPDTVLIANEVTEGPLYEEASEVIADAIDMIVFEIKLESKGVRTQPDGKVKISIPLPADFGQAPLAVYRIDSEDGKTQFPVTRTTENGINYATFETDHFSIFVLAKLEEYKYPYTVAYYRDNVSEENLIGTIPGVVMFPENYELTAADVAADIHEAWLDAKKPAAGYYGGVVQGGYPIISRDASDNTVKVLYAINYAVDDGGMAEIITETRTPEAARPDELDNPVANEKRHERYIRGCGDNNLKPDDKLTRAEMAMVLYNLLTAHTQEPFEQKQVFADVDTNAWYAKAVAYLYDKGIVRGYEDKTYRPNVRITYAEMVVLVSRFDNLNAAEAHSFSDVAGAHWAKHYLESAEQKGWMHKHGGEVFHSDSYVTRAEMMVVVNKALNRRVRREDLLPNMPAWSDVSPEHWAYADIMEAAHSHIYERENEDDFETWIRISE